MRPNFKATASAARLPQSALPDCPNPASPSTQSHTLAPNEPAQTRTFSAVKAPACRSLTDLTHTLSRIDGASYGAYKQLRGSFHLPGFELFLDRIQADPYAPPSACRIRFSPSCANIPTDFLRSSADRLAVADFLARCLRRGIRQLGQPGEDLAMAPIGQEILQRTYATVTPEYVELRFQVHLPARGRTALGKKAATLFTQTLPKLLTQSVLRHEPQSLAKQVHTHRDYQALQNILKERNWISFIADGSKLARRSGISELVLNDCLPTIAPEAFAHELELPHAGTIRGIAIPAGITLIVGGGYHGKSTLLHAIERGVYPHIPADGRELVATQASALTIRAENGRCVTGVDITPFIDGLPGGRGTASFSTDNASGSTSQSAGIIEALELGAQTLLIDEDNSATNLLIRDSRMRALVEDKNEPITPFIEHIEHLRTEGISTVLVTGGSGAYLDVADRVIMMNNFVVTDATAQAQAVCAKIPKAHSCAHTLVSVRQRLRRVPRPCPCSDSRGRKVRARRLESITLDHDEIDVSTLSQLVDCGQTVAIGRMISYLLDYEFDGKSSLVEAVDRLMERISYEGLDILGPRTNPSGFMVMPRRTEVICALNRYRELELISN